MINFDQIPNELKNLDQWVCWKNDETKGKIPFNPITGAYGSSTDSKTWTTFKEAQKRAGRFDGIGFVITETDPYCFIDLDDPDGDTELIKKQNWILRNFQSYTEFSPSGKGLHVIVKGSIKSFRIKGIEVYSSKRYMTMTGNVYVQKPIVASDNQLALLSKQSVSSNNEKVSNPDEIKDTNSAKRIDNEIMATAWNAKNGEKFRSLWLGQWQENYPSQSEADLALMNMIAFYSNNREQSKRLFLRSKLGERDKAKRDDYMNRMINRAFEDRPPEIDFGFLKTLRQQAVSKSKIKPALNLPTEKKSKTQFVEPPGLLGEITDFLYRSSPRPAKEIALAGAIGFLAGICGRSYNVSNVGLNMYVLLIADTGTGKESMSSGIDKIIQQIKYKAVNAKRFVGPVEIASGQALFKYMSNNPSFVSILGEYGLRLKQMSDHRASTSEQALRRIILDLYGKSGHGKTLQPAIYSDKIKNTSPVRSPAFSILAESTPNSVFQHIDENTIEQGLLPRFLITEYSGNRPPFNSKHADAFLSTNTEDRLTELCVTSHQINENDGCINVQMTENATEKSKEIDLICDATINASDDQITKHLWTRVHLKVLKLAALVAVGENFLEPEINMRSIQWAYNLVKKDTNFLEKRFQTGNIGSSSSEGKQIEIVFKYIAGYIKSPWDVIKSYSNNENMHAASVVPFSYLQRRLVNLRTFREDRIGATGAINRTVKLLIDTGDLIEIDKATSFSKFNFRGRCFVVNNNAILTY